VALTWAGTGVMKTSRASHSATLLLPNGKVLVAGGQDNSSLTQSTVELYDTGALTWSTTGALNTFRYNHTATLLPNGKVLVAGGLNITDYSTTTNSTTRQP